MEPDEMREAFVLMDTVQRFLRSERIPLKADAKGQIRFRIEMGQESAAQYLRDCYTAEDTPCLVASVGSSLVVADRSMGIQVGDIGFRWDELIPFIKEMCRDGQYMTPAEERFYQQRMEMFQRRRADRMEELISSQNPQARAKAAEHFGPSAWDRLLSDPDEYVRLAVAFYGTDEYRLKLVKDPDPLVRMSIADKGGESVHQALLDQKEQDVDVIKKIAEKGSDAIQIKLVHAYEDSPDVLRQFSGQLRKGAKAELLRSSDPHVVVLGISDADRECCANLLQTPGLTADERFAIGNRLEELREMDFDISL